MAKLKIKPMNVKSSNKIHLRLADINNDKGLSLNEENRKQFWFYVKRNYHETVIREQNKFNRVLTKNERKNLFKNSVYDLADGKHGANPANHIKALKCLIKTKIKRGYKDLETIVHSDQGVIYSSMVFANTHKDYNIKRSMSRAGTPTDNPIIESLNGWIKEELVIDFNLYKTDDVHKTIKDYIKYYNNERLAYSLQYKSPVQYRTELSFN